MQIYIAAPYPIHSDAAALAQQLRGHGHTITSTWVDLPPAAESSHDDAAMDLDNIIKADVLLALNPEAWANSGSGGRHVEFGYALALGLHMIVLGVRTQLFHYLNRVVVVETVEGVLQALRDETERMLIDRRGP